MIENLIVLAGMTPEERLEFSEEAATMFRKKQRITCRRL